MRRWTIGRKLFTGTAALNLLLVLTAGASLWSATSIQRQLEETGYRTARRLELAQSVQSGMFELFAGERMMILAGFDNDRPLRDASASRIETRLQTLKAQIVELKGLMRVESGKQAATKLEAGADSWMAAHAEVVRLIDAGEFHAAQQHSLHNGQPIMDANQTAAEVIVGNQRKFLASDMQAAQTSFARARLIVVLLAALSFAIGALVVLVVRGVNTTLRRTTLRLHEGAEQIVAASTQVASSAQSLASGASEQASSLEETSASMEEMSSMTMRTAENSQEAATLMADADRMVSESQRALAGMVSAMTGIQESSARVSKIIRTIDEIAFQTNILALNAAVEAARAGEAGMGFAVVADEVRNLAQRSAAAAKDTSSLLEESSAMAAEGSRRVELVVGSIEAITERVSGVKRLVDELSSAGRQQSQGISQVTQAVSQMEQITQNAAATAEESAAASEELNAQAQSSMRLVGELEQLVGREGVRRGSSQRAARPRSSPSSATVTRLPVASRPSARTRPTPEQELPLESTGTYGSF
jgi:methyl-accepting chemotaxis protein